MNEHSPWYRRIMEAGAQTAPKLDTNANPITQSWGNLARGGSSLATTLLGGASKAGDAIEAGAIPADTGAIPAVKAGLGAAGSALGSALPVAAGLGAVAALPLWAKGVNAFGDWLGSKMPKSMYGYTPNAQWDNYTYWLSNQPGGGQPSQEGYDEWMRQNGEPS